MKIAWERGIFNHGKLVFCVLLERTCIVAALYLRNQKRALHFKCSPCYHCRARDCFDTLSHSCLKPMMGSFNVSTNVVDSLILTTAAAEGTREENNCQLRASYSAGANA